MATTNSWKCVISTHALTYKTLAGARAGKGKNNEILMGSFVKVTDQTSDSVYWQVSAFGIDGWIKASELGDSPGLKIYYVDVGQGDAVLIEVGGGSNMLRILIDGGPGDNLHRYLSKWQYKYYFDKDEKVKIDYVFVSHFDKDHYNGLIHILEDERFTFGTVFHAGICKFMSAKANRPSNYNTSLGETTNGKLITTFDSLQDLIGLWNGGGMQALMGSFLDALIKANAEGRLKEVKRMDHGSTAIIKTINGLTFSIEPLGPITTKHQGKAAFDWFKDESHTVNGHSLVLKLTYGTRTFLFGGDLNSDSEDHLLTNHSNHSLFKVDVAKSCHHGSSDFTIDFMKVVNPYATVISSGDNESYSHPRADAIGCAGKYARGTRPLVFSTELARSTNVKTDEIKYGMINCRCDGTDIIMAQMKESYKDGDVWDLYEVP